MKNYIFQQTSGEWRLVLIISAIVPLVGAVVYGLFASSELAPWSKDAAIEIEITVDCEPNQINKT